ncbi:MAG TPA: trypco2 family protein [Nonomuraea sp.]|nr:trypco2 family protein [Nonomuraea sp.]
MGGSRPAAGGWNDRVKDVENCGRMVSIRVYGSWFTMPLSVRVRPRSTPGMGMDIELTEAIAVLRNELLQAAAAGSAEDLKFGVRQIDLEFEVELRASAEAKAGFKAWLVSTEAKGAVERGRTHRVAISIVPSLNGGDVEINEGTKGTKGKFGMS